MVGAWGSDANFNCCLFDRLQLFKKYCYVKNIATVYKMSMFINYHEL